MTLRRSLAAMALAGIAFNAGLATGSVTSPPAGATARCRDGTYSYSQHRSGTCSHHGGVAEWLTGSGSSREGSSTRTIAVGTTVLLGRRTKTGGCTLGPDPDRRCSPGAYYSKLTKQVICSSSFHTSSVRNVPDSEKLAVEQEYGMAPGHYGRTLEIDHIVSLELGGSNDITNLFPEKANAHPGYHAKDKLENKLHDLVCAGAMTLTTAQRHIASNWEGLYKDVFGATPVG